MLGLRPHELALILFWRILGKRVRARGRMRAAVAGLPLSLIRRMDQIGKEDVAALLAEGGKIGGVRICAHIHVPQSHDRTIIRRALAALEGQSYQPERVFVSCEEGADAVLPDSSIFHEIEARFVTPMEGLRAALDIAQEIGADWLVPCEGSFQLTRHALAAYCAKLLGASKEVTPGIVYGDTYEASGQWLPGKRYWLKPQWDGRMLLSQDYVTGGCALAVGPALSSLETDTHGSVQSLYQLVIKMSETHKVSHVDRFVACHKLGAWCRADQDHKDTLRRVLGAQASVSSGPFGSVEVRWALPKRLPTVSVIVATRDRVELLQTCVEGVLNETDYPSLDLIVADNDSVEPEALSYLDDIASDPRVQVVRWPFPFNYSAINNFAAAHAKGEYICLLNNDIEVIESNWLTEMVREAIQPEVGAVGARLLYPDRSIQHAGVAIGIGNAAGHAHRGLPEGEPGYYAQAHIARGASAVTAACLLVRKDHFDAVDGLDEEGLAVAYNDVDLCLKLRAKGLRNIYAPLATLIHHESKSRGLDFAPEHLTRYMEELEVFQKRWHTKSVVDPWHHLELDRSSETFNR